MGGDTYLRKASFLIDTILTPCRIYKNTAADARFKCEWEV